MRRGVALFATLAACGGDPKQSAAPDAPHAASSAAPAPPGFGGVKAEPARVELAGRLVPYANVFARRLPNTDATRLYFVRSASTQCETLPARGDGELIAELVVSRFLTAREDAAHPSKRPLSVASATVFDGGAALELDAIPAPLGDPFIEPTTATVMFGTVDLALPKGATLRGTVMAQVCPQEPPAADAVENAPSGLNLTFEGVRLRVRGVIERRGEIRLSTAPLRCDDSAQGDLDLTLSLDSNGLRTMSSRGWSTKSESSYEGTRGAKRNSKGELELDLRGSLGPHAIELVGTAQPRACPKGP